MSGTWKRTNPTEPVKVGWRTVTKKTFVDSDGKVFDADVYGKDGEQGVAVVAITIGGQAIVCRQYRFGPERMMDELPGGFVDVGEDHKVAAIRELAEETGYVAGKIDYLGYSFRDAWSNDISHYYIATECYPSEKGRQLDDTEEIDVILLDLQQLIASACNGHMTDPAAVLMAYEQLIKIQDKSDAESH